MILSIIDKKTGDQIHLDIKDYHAVDDVFIVYEYINNISDFDFNIKILDND